MSQPLGFGALWGTLGPPSDKRLATSHLLLKARATRNTSGCQRYSFIHSASRSFIYSLSHSFNLLVLKMGTSRANEILHVARSLKLLATSTMNLSDLERKNLEMASDSFWWPPVGLENMRGLSLMGSIGAKTKAILASRRPNQISSKTTMRLH